MKRSCAAVGATGMRRLAEQIEAAAAETDRDRIAGPVAMLEQSFDDVRAALRSAADSARRSRRAS